MYRRCDNRNVLKRKLIEWLIAGWCCAVLPATTAQGQTPAPPVETEPQSEAVSLTDVAGASERDLARSGAIESEFAAQPELDAIRAALPAFRKEVDMRLRESRKILASRSSVSSLRTLENDWLAVRRTPAAWRRTLDGLARRSEEELGNISQIADRWSQTRDAAGNDQSTPAAVRDRINDTLRNVQDTRAAVEKARTAILTLQARVAELDARVENEIETIRKSRGEAMSRLLDKDSPAIGSFVRSMHSEALRAEMSDTLSTQWEALKAYAERRAETFALHALAFAALLTILTLVARQVRGWVKQEPALIASTKVFDIPVAMAVMLSLLSNPWIYPQAPRLWTVALKVAALLPAALIVRHLLNPALFAALSSLVAFFLLDQLREVTASIAAISRLLLSIESIAGVVWMAYLGRRGGIAAAEQASEPKFWRVVRGAYWLACGVFALSLLANIFGFVELSNILLSTMLSSAYAALFFYALLRIIDGIVLSALRLYPLRGLRVVQRHGVVVRRRIMRVLQWGAWLLWLLDLLERLSLRAPLLAALERILGARSDLGSLHISLGDLLACGLAIVLAFMISRLARFVLEEEVYPHLELPRGMPYALSRLLHYVILVIGFIIAIAAAGVDLTRFTILVSAFGVGIGFGLQQIINNFVSGLILLFERPVQVGDSVQIADITGVIQRIGIRASVVRLANGANVIVPNSNFITERVTNRSFSNPERIIEIRVGVAYGVDPQQAVALLQGVAAKHEKISKTPAPQALFAEFGEHAVYFTLRAEVDDPLTLAQTRSELGVAINDLFAAGKLHEPARTSQKQLETQPA